MSVLRILTEGARTKTHFRSQIRNHRDELMLLYCRFTIVIFGGSSCFCEYVELATRFFFAKHSRNKLQFTSTYF